MNHIRFWLPVLLVIILLASCSPTAVPLVETTNSPLMPPAILTVEPTLAGTDALSYPTSRGPDLFATDPSTVNLASGGLLLVEFFRFT
jgi:hypothetical protein